MAQPFPAATSSYGQNGNYGGTYTGSIPSAGAVQGGALPPPSSAAAPVVQHSEISSRHTSGWSAQDGSRVTLRPGETIYTLSRRYGIPADAIMRANGISSASDVHVGRQIVIPTYDGRGRTVASAPMTRSAEPMPAERPEPKLASAAMARPAEQHSARRTELSRTGKTYTVQSGDTLTRIASRTGVSIDALKNANNLSGAAIRIGQTLKLPDGASAPAKPVRTAEVVTGSVPTTAPSRKAPAQPKPAPVKAVEAKTQEPVKVAEAEPQPKSYSPPAQQPTTGVAQVEADTKVASLPQTSGVGKLRWPARGQVVSQFGSREDGHRNDGIDISVPEGTPIKAAENGVVIYAGNGLKEYGNTVLIRHDDGLVTVYGYAKDLKVQRGDKVTRGQVIADSGMSGEANRPKLHFEVRKDATPVNPMSYLD